MTVRIRNEYTGLVDYRPALQEPEPGGIRYLLVVTLVALAFILGFATGAAQAAQPPMRGMMGPDETHPEKAVAMTGETCIRAFEVRPGITFRHRRYDLEARVRLEQHADHRAYSVTYQADNGHAGGVTRELNTLGPDELSPITQDPLRWREKPGGRYVFVLAVYGAGGKLLERRTAEIRVAGEDQR